jgi:acetyl-CoA carboxylase carboxyltransferase component
MIGHNYGVIIIGRYHYFLLAQVETRHAYKLDENRPAAVARREATGQRTARANVMDMCDDGSVVGRGRASLLTDLDSCHPAPCTEA